MARVLLLCLENSGHENAARAVEAALLLRDPAVQTLCLDAVTHSHPRISALIHTTYLGIVKQTPELWEAMYDSERLERLTRRVRWLIQRGNSRSFADMLVRFAPDAVVCTQAYSFGVMTAYQEQHGSEIPLFGVITDYRPHRFWVAGGTGVYFAPTPEAAQRLESLGVAASRIRVHGIPVHPEFVRGAHVQPSVGPTVPRVLVMGGTHGLGITHGMIRRLDASDEDFVIDIVTGRNRILRRKLMAVRSRFHHPVRIRGYVNSLAPLMRKADLLISKPGGLTCAEAMVAGVPMLMVRPLPGQETGNAIELSQRGVGLRVEDDRELPAVVGALMRNRKLLGIMKERAAGFGQPEAADRIAMDVLSAIRTRRPASPASPS